MGIKQIQATYITDRYKISFEELSEGGAEGYKSTFLTSEADIADEKLYEVLSTFEGSLLPVINRTIRQRNGKNLVDALSQNQQVGIASGFKPSGACHFGHGLTSAAVIFFQKNGAQIFMPVADIEARLDGIPEKEYLFWAADNLLDWGAMGVNLDATHAYLQSEEFRGFSLVPHIIGNKKEGLSFDLPLDIYGREKIVEDFSFIVSGITQISDILLPQHNAFGNYHSFMVSGQDQDGHMKMTSEATQRAMRRKDIQKLGIQTIPSGFYIPHIRGISGDKASSSKAEGTLYLGSGPQQEGLDERITSTLRRFDNADREHLNKCALDMVRFIDVFNRESKVNFVEVAQTYIHKDLVKKLDTAGSRTEQQKVQAELDDYLVSFYQYQKQDNIAIVRNTLPTALREIKS